MFDWAFRDSENFNEGSWVVRNHPIRVRIDDLSEEDIDKNVDFTIGETYHIIVALTKSDENNICKWKVTMLYFIEH